MDKNKRKFSKHVKSIINIVIYTVILLSIDTTYGRGKSDEGSYYTYWLDSYCGQCYAISPNGSRTKTFLDSCKDIYLAKRDVCNVGVIKDEITGKDFIFSVSRKTSREFYCGTRQKVNNRHSSCFVGTTYGSCYYKNGDTFILPKGLYGTQSNEKDIKYKCINGVLNKVEKSYVQDTKKISIMPEPKENKDFVYIKSKIVNRKSNIIYIPAISYSPRVLTTAIAEVYRFGDISNLDSSEIGNIIVFGKSDLNVHNVDIFVFGNDNGVHVFGDIKLRTVNKTITLGGDLTGCKAYRNNIDAGVTLQIYSLSGCDVFKYKTVRNKTIITTVDSNNNSNITRYIVKCQDSDVYVSNTDMCPNFK